MISCCCVSLIRWSEAPRTFYEHLSPCGAAPPLSEEGGAIYAAPSLARAEWEHICRVLADSGGNVSDAARRLGMHRRTLQRKLNKAPPPD